MRTLHTFSRGVGEQQVFVALLQDSDAELRPPLALLNGAHVAATPVSVPHAPVQTASLISGRENGVGRVEVGHQGRWKLPHGVKEQAAHTKRVSKLWTLNGSRQLPQFIALDIDATENRKTAQLLVLQVQKGTGTRDSGPMLVAQHGFVLKKGASGLQSACEVVDVEASESVATAGGAQALAEGAGDSSTPLTRLLHVDQGTCLGFVHLRGPEGAVQMNPSVQVQVEEASSTVRHPVTLLMAEATAAPVSERWARTQRRVQLKQEILHRLLRRRRSGFRDHDLHRPLAPTQAFPVFPKVPGFLVRLVLQTRLELYS